MFIFHHFLYIFLEKVAAVHVMSPASCPSLPDRHLFLSSNPPEPPPSPSPLPSSHPLRLLPPPPAAPPLPTTPLNCDDSTWAGGQKKLSHPSPDGSMGQCHPSADDGKSTANAAAIAVDWPVAHFSFNRFKGRHRQLATDFHSVPSSFLKMLPDSWGMLRDA